MFSSQNANDKAVSVAVFFMTYYTFFTKYCFLAAAISQLTHLYCENVIEACLPITIQAAKSPVEVLFSSFSPLSQERPRYPVPEQSQT